jgi:hypothetical protein
MTVSPEWNSPDSEEEAEAAEAAEEGAEADADMVAVGTSKSVSERMGSALATPAAVDNPTAAKLELALALA